MTAPAMNPVAKPFFVRAFALIHPYWSRSGERGLACLLLLSILALTLGLVYLNVLYNFWNRNFFNALEKKDVGAFWSLIPYFFGLSAVTVGGTALQAYLTQMLQMKWRIWMTHEYLDAWLGDRRFYHLELDARGTDNPDQRIAEDLKQLTTSTLELSLGLLHNLVTLVSFTAILWNVSHTISFGLFGATWSISGDMVWAALFYAVAGSAATYFVGRSLIGLRFQQERLEADMRFNLMRTREYAEGIALYKGEAAERSSIDDRIDGLRSNWRAIMMATFKLNGLSSAYTQIGILFPYFLASPRYFTGQMPLGGLTQIAGAFDTVRTALSWFVFNYQSLAAWKASVDRLLTFEAAIAAIGQSGRDGTIGVRQSSDSALTSSSLTLMTPRGDVITSIGDIEIKPGERVLLRGEPGAGKSTLFRAIAGLWPFGRGQISRPPERATLFLPQRPYVPIGSLAAAVCYPSLARSVPERSIQAALAAVGLDKFDDRLDETANWSQVLSGGEQQKLAIARALLQKPEWLFLDEATSALDELTEAALYKVMRRELPDTAIISIAHHLSLASGHDRVVEIRTGGR